MIATSAARGASDRLCLHVHTDINETESKRTGAGK